MNTDPPGLPDLETSAQSGVDHLLSPTLSDASASPLFSLRAHFFVAFFGGVYATLFLRYADVAKLGRTRRELPLLAVIFVAWTALLIALAYSARSGAGLFAFLPDRRDLRVSSRIVAIAVFGLYQYRLRRYYKAAELSGHAAPSPWRAGGIAVALALLITLLATAVGTAIAPAGRPL